MDKYTFPYTVINYVNLNKQLHRDFLIFFSYPSVDMKHNIVIIKTRKSNKCTDQKL